MASEMDTSNAISGENSQKMSATGASLLLVVGEPFSDDHKNLILAEVTKGFRCWDVEATGIDINDELAQIANRADLGEEGPNGERIIRHRSDNVAVEILVNPQKQSVSAAVKNFLSTISRHKHLIYAGHTFQGTGAWILQDDTFTYGNFAHAFKDSDVENAIKQQEGATLAIHCLAEGDWSRGHIVKSDFSKLLKVVLNPEEKLTNIHGVLQFTAYISNFIKVRSVNELLQASDVVGNIRFSKPTLYIFPGCQGDSALFGISGFNLLVNGGYSRKSCFWDFTRHLDRIDAALMTHLGTDNLYGFLSVLERKSVDNVHPEIGYMYLNASEKMRNSVGINGTEETKEPKLMVNLAEEGNKLVEYSKQIGQTPQPCSRGSSLEPINLYHKVGHGSLDMYILNPVTDSKEMKDFYQQWNQTVSHFGTNQHVPLPNTLSVCALLVWRPADPNEKITRIFFPGNAPQHKIIEGLDRLKNLDVLKHAKCCNKSLHAKPAGGRKSTGPSTRPPSGRSKVSPGPAASKPEMVKKEHTPRSEVKATPKPKQPSAPKAKMMKEDVNKKTSKGAEKTDKTKSSTSSSPSKASTKSATPSDTPKDLISPATESETAPVVEAKAEQVEMPPAAPVEPQPSEPVVDEVPVVNNLLDMSPEEALQEPSLMDVKQERPDLMNQLESESPAPLPEPGQYGAEPVEGKPMNDFGFGSPEKQMDDEVMDKNKMIEMGIYDDEEEEADLSPNAEPIQRIPDKQTLADLGVYDDSPENENVAPHEPFSGGYDEQEEEVQPQALPEPVAYPPSSFTQEPDIIPNMPSMNEEKTEAAVAAPVQEPDVLPSKPDIPELDLTPSGEPSTAPVMDDESPMSDEGYAKSPLPEEPEQKSEAEVAQAEQMDKDDIVTTPEEMGQQFPLDEGTSSLPTEPVPAPFEEISQTEEPAEEVPVEEIKGQDIASDVEPAADLDVEQALKQMDESIDEAANKMNTESEDLVSREEDFKSCEMETPEETQAEEELPEIQDSLDKHVEEYYFPEAEEQMEKDVHEQVEEVTQASTGVEEEKIEVDKVTQEQEATPGQQAEQEELESEEEMVEDVKDSQPATSPFVYEKPVELEDEKEGPEEKEKSPELEQAEYNQQAVDQGEPVTNLMTGSFVEHSDEVTPEQDVTPENEGATEVPDLMSGSFIEHPDEAAPDLMTSSFHEQREPDLMSSSFTEKVEEVDPSQPKEPEIVEQKLGQDEEEDEEEEEDSEVSEESIEEDEDTDKKCLLQEPTSEGQDSDLPGMSPMIGIHERTIPEDKYPSLIGMAAQKTDILTPESDTTEPSQGMPVDYQEMENHDGEDDEDSVEVDSQDEDKDVDESPVGHQVVDTSPWNQGTTDGFGMGPAEPSGVASDPFDVTDKQGFNPFHGIEQQGGEKSPVGSNPFQDSSPEDQQNPDFNPLTEWGEPMGLPSPPPPEEAKANTKPAATNGKGPAKSPRDKAKAGTKPTEAKKPEPKKPAASSAKPSTNLTRTSKTANGVAEPKTKPSRLSSGAAEKSMNTSRLGSATDRKAPPKTRPASAPVKDKPVKDEPKSRPMSSRRPGTADTSRASPSTTKMPPLPPFNPFYVDLTYIPNHGNPHYSDIEFFKRIRARYYVLSSQSPNPQILNSLMDAKKTWEDKDLEVTVIPTYDNDTLRHWMGLHKEKLVDLNIDVAPSASRCTIQLQDHETSCSAYRLEF